MGNTRSQKLCELGALALIELLVFLLFILAIIPTVLNYCHTQYVSFTQAKLASELQKVEQLPAIEIAQNVTSNLAQPLFVPPNASNLQSFFNRFTNHFQARSSGDIFLRLYYLRIKPTDTNTTTPDAGTLVSVGGVPWTLISTNSYENGVSAGVSNGQEELRQFAENHMTTLQDFSDINTPGPDPGDVAVGIKLYDVMAPVDTNPSTTVANWEYVRLRSFVDLFPLLFIRICEQVQIPLVPQKLICNNYTVLPRVPVGSYDG